MAKSKTQQIINLYIKASAGDMTALNTMQADIRRLSKRANQRLLRLERAGFDYGSANAAYRYTIAYNGKKRFAINGAVLSDPKLMREQLLVLDKFLRAKTSTLAGAKANAERVQQLFEERYKVNFESSEDRDNFLRALGDSGVQEALKLVGKGTSPSKRIVESLTIAWDRGTKAYNRAYRAIKKFRSGSITYDELVRQLDKEDSDASNKV